MWAIVELMGHNTLAGEVCPSSEFPGLIQINVPETAQQGQWTKIVNPSAVYAINPVTEETARLKAESLDANPISLYDVRQRIISMLSQDARAELAENNDQIW